MQHRTKITKKPFKKVSKRDKGKFNTNVRPKKEELITLKINLMLIFIFLSHGYETKFHYYFISFLPIHIGKKCQLDVKTSFFKNQKEQIIRPFFPLDYYNNQSNLTTSNVYKKIMLFI